jgi:hypothetical protein
MDKVSSRKVSTESAFNLAALEMNIGFLETSAYLNLNVDSVFHCILNKYTDCNTENKHAKRSRISSDSEFKRQKPKSIASKTTKKQACKSAYLILK